MPRSFSIVLACIIVMAARIALGMELYSPAFSPGGEISVKYTCDGADLSPPLRWSDPPEKHSHSAKRFAKAGIR